MSAIPDSFDATFLDWLQDQMEKAWTSYEPVSFEDYVAGGVGGVDWQRNTRWLEGLSEPEIDRIEHQWAIRFPPDYRLFLRHLHTVDRPMRGARYTEYIEGGPGSHMVPNERSLFYNWLTGSDELKRALDWPLDGLLFDIEHSGLWLPGWGPRPATLSDQEAHVRALAAAAPRLIPVFEHRYLPSEPCQPGNPVLSIYQSDIVLYASNLRSYFLFEFSELLGLQTPHDRLSPDIDRAEHLIGRLPFWGDVYAWNNKSSSY